MHEEKVLEDLQDIDQDDLPDKAKYKKYIVGGMSIILTLLMLSFVIVSYPIGDIITGQLVSSPLENNQIDVDDFSIILSEQTQAQLQAFYVNQQEVEWSACLQGEKIKGDYYISSLYQPDMFQQTFNHVSFAPCSAETLVLLHTHPYKSCIASDTDLNTLARMQEENVDVLMVVMCQPDRFSVYR
jgi:proteasome lid subunit RPN8/RPN11